MSSRTVVAALLLTIVDPAIAKDALVFVGATGDNALRQNGVWQGIYEAFVGGMFTSDSLGIHVAMNTPHTSDELHTKVVACLTPLQDELRGNAGWTCRAPDGDCSAKRLLQDVVVSVWEGRDANAQAASMAAALADSGVITVYLSIPPFVFGSWSRAAAGNWGGHRVNVVAEKPFGTSLEDADQLHRSICDAGVPAENVHLADHWLSFFMNRNLPKFRRIVESKLGVEWSGRSFSRIVVTEFEVRGLGGRGNFFDGVGQVRDMVQSHLLQVLALALIAPDAAPRSEAKLAILNRTSVSECALGQYDGFLLEPGLQYHAGFADSTLCAVFLKLAMDAWQDVEIIIQTGKDMGAMLYTVEFFQRDGPGVLTYEIGKEETGTGSVSVRMWPLRDSGAFEAPAAGFDGSKTVRVTPAVTPGGNGSIVSYDAPGLYFPKPYAVMLAELFAHRYEMAFVTYPECRRSWAIATAGSPSRCLDPKPGGVVVYKPPAACGNAPPHVCFQHGETVADLYGRTFRCTPEHDKLYAYVTLYRAKCHPAPVRAAAVDELIIYA